MFFRHLNLLRNVPVGTCTVITQGFIGFWTVQISEIEPEKIVGVKMAPGKFKESPQLPVFFVQRECHSILDGTLCLVLLMRLLEQRHRPSKEG